MNGFAGSNPVALDAELRAFGEMPGGLLPALHAVQHRHGYIDQAFIPALADLFNVSQAEVHGVITFYKDFHTEPRRGPAIQVCRAEACQSRGANAVHARAVELGVSAQVEVEEVFCLGNCALGPSVAVDGVFADTEAVRNGGIVESARDQAQHLQLAGGQSARFGAR